MTWTLLIGACLAAAGVGAAIYIITKLTYEIIRRFRKKQHTDVVAVSMDKIAASIRNDPRVTRKKISQLNDYDAVVAECDPYTNSVVQTKLCSDLDYTVRTDIIEGGGFAIYED